MLKAPLPPLVEILSPRLKFRFPASSDSLRVRLHYWQNKRSRRRLEFSSASERTPYDCRLVVSCFASKIAVLINVRL